MPNACALAAQPGAGPPAGAAAGQGAGPAAGAGTRRSAAPTPTCSSQAEVRERLERDPRLDALLASRRRGKPVAEALAEVEQRFGDPGSASPLSRLSRAARGFEPADGVVLRQQEAQLVDAVQQAVAGERIDRELRPRAVGQGQRLLLQRRRSPARPARPAAWRAPPASTTIGSRPFLSALLRKMSANEVLITARKP